MAFWGVEVKPGKPYTHRYQSSHGRLRISQATLGSCDAAKRSVLQCVVGTKAPIIVCSLNPRLAEMCHLEIELEEVDEVLFSVLGPSSVHLSGYYLRPSSRSGAGDDESESYGEDVGESDTDRDYDESEDSYESDFIDDGDDEVPEDNDVSESMDDGAVCSSPDSHKTASEKHAGKVKRLRRSKKKHQVDSTDDEIEDSSCKPTTRHNFRSIFDSSSEDEDLPANKTNASEEHADKVKRGRRLKKKHQVDSIDDKIEDSSCKPTFRRKPCSIFDSGSEDEDFLAKEEDLPSLSEKTNGKVCEENKPENVASKEETKKKSRNDRKRNSDTIDQDPASPMAGYCSTAADQSKSMQARYARQTCTVCSRFRFFNLLPVQVIIRAQGVLLFTSRRKKRGRWSCGAFEVGLMRKEIFFECDCWMYEHMGIICCHVIRILSSLGRTEIPGSHIMQRWTKNACRDLPEHLRIYQKDSPAMQSTSFRHTARRLKPRVIQSCHEQYVRCNSQDHRGKQDM